MLANMASSLIQHKRIYTTLAKAKALRKFVEPLITRSKEDTTHSRRMVFRYLRSKEAVSMLFKEVSTKINERAGGYTRILKTDIRQGDNSNMCMMELVDYNPNLLSAKVPTGKAKTTRRGRKKAPVASVTDNVVVETATAPTTGNSETTETKAE